MRLVVPWKYGFKGIKAIVKIKLVDRAADLDVDQSCAERVRLLLERKSQRRSSALEPGQGAPHRRIHQASDADVQRLRRPGGVAVHRHGPEEELLIAPNVKPKYLKPIVFLACLVPLGRLAWKAYNSALGRQPDSGHHLVHRHLDAGVPDGHAVDHAAAQADAAVLAHPVPPHAGTVRLLLRAAALHRPTSGLTSSSTGTA